MYVYMLQECYVVYTRVREQVLNSSIHRVRAGLRLNVGLILIVYVHVCHALVYAKQFGRYFEYLVYIPEIRVCKSVRRVMGSGEALDLAMVGDNSILYD